MGALLSSEEKREKALKNAIHTGITLAEATQKGYKTVDEYLKTPEGQKRLAQGKAIGKEVGKIAFEGLKKIAGTEGSAYEELADMMPESHNGGGEGGISGGRFIGGADFSVGMMDEYPESLNSATKRRLIRAVIKAFEEMGISVGVDKNDDSISIIDKMLEVIPNDRNKKSFRANADEHAKTCKTIANAINNALPKPILNTDVAPELLCQQIAELVFSVRHEMNVELAGVSKSVQQILRNILVIKDLLQDVNKPLVDMADQMAQNKEVTTTQKFSAAKHADAVNLLYAEMERQMSMLQNMLDQVITPVDRDLQKLMDDDLRTLIMSPDSAGTAGTTQFSHTLAKVLRGVLFLGKTAHLLEETLKDIGMTMKEYNSDNGLAVLERKYEDSIKDLDSDEYGKLTQAYEYLKNNFEKYRNISNDMVHGSGQDRDHKINNNDLVDTPMKKSIDRSASIKRLLFKVFDRKMHEQVATIHRGLRGMLSKLGTDSVSTDEDSIMRLRNALMRLRPMTELKNAYLVLIGYYNDALSRERRETYVSQLQDIASAAADVRAKSTSQEVNFNLKLVEDAVHSIIKLMETYAEKVKDKFGAGERKMEGCKCGEDCDDDCDCGCHSAESAESVEGGAAEHVSEVYRGEHVNMGDIIKEFDYQFRAAKMQESLGKSKLDVETISSGYSDYRGKAIAKRIDDLTDDCNEALKAFKKDYDMVYKKNSTLKDEVKDMPVFIKNAYNARIGLWQVAEAMDEYMKLFTNDLIKNANDIGDIRAMLSDTDIIYDWYNQKTGALVHQVFDQMPHDDLIVNTTSNKLELNKATHKDWEHGVDHYYSHIKDDTKLGHPLKSTVPNDDKYGFSGIKLIFNVFQNLAILKNIMSVFIHIGDKMSGKNIHERVFMKPIQMYKLLVKYLAYSTYDYGDHNLISFSELDEFKSQYGLIMRSCVDEPLHRGRGVQEDKMFTLIIKSMCSKVLVLSGVQDLTKRPKEHQGMTRVRQILGGADMESAPTIHGELAELYLRLPLLAEFYRDLFEFDKNDYISNSVIEDRAERISMLPEADGVFSGLVHLIFRRARNYKINELTRYEYMELVAEINKIWEAIKARKDGTTAKDVLHMFIDDINARYGIISKDEYETYVSRFGTRADYSKHSTLYSDMDSYREQEIPILPEEEYSMHDQPSVYNPSSRYQTKGSNEFGEDIVAKKALPYLAEHHQKLIAKLRCKLDSYFRSETKDIKVDDTPYNNLDKKSQSYKNYKKGTLHSERLSFRPLFHSVERQLSNTSDPEKRMDLVVKLFNSKAVVNMSGDLINVMFHETVVSSLNALSAIHTVLANFRDIVLLTDVETIGMNLSGLKSLNDDADVNDVNDMIYALRKKWNMEDTSEDNYSNLLDASKYTELYTFSPNNLNPANALVHLLEAVFAVSQDTSNLVPVHIDEENITIQWSKLRTLVENLLDSASKYMDIFRNQLSEDIITKYTKKTKVGSLYWLREQLYEKLIVGRERINDQHPYPNVDELVRIMNKSMKELRKKEVGTGFAELLFYKIKDSKVKLYNIHNTKRSFDKAKGLEYEEDMGKLYLLNRGMQYNAFPEYSTRYKQLYSWHHGVWGNNQSLLFAYNQLLAKYLAQCYDPSSEKIYMGCLNNYVNGPASAAVHDVKNMTFPDGPRGGKVTISIGGDYRNDKTFKLMDRIRNLPAEEQVNSSSLALIHDTINKIEDNEHKLKLDVTLEDVLQHRLIAQLPNSFTDLIDDRFGSAKYLIGPAATYFNEHYGRAAGIITSSDQFGKEAPSAEDSTEDLSAWADPKSDNVIYTSLALVMRNILQSKNASNQTVIYQLDNIAEITPHMRESMKANLPFFRQLFLQLAKKAEFIQKTMSLNETNMVRAKNTFGSDHMKQLLTNRANDNYSAHNRDHFSAIAESIKRGCQSLVTCVDGVLRELADDPQYMEIYAGSIDTYKSMNGELPLGLLSNLLLPVRPREGEGLAVRELMPIGNMSSASQKYMYATRQVFGRPNEEIKMHSMKLVDELFNKYNSLMSEHNKIAKSETYIQSFVAASRWLQSVHVSKFMITPILSSLSRKSDPVTTDTATGTGKLEGNRLLESMSPDSANNNIIAYALKHNMRSVINLTESAPLRIQVSKVGDYINGVETQNVDDMVIANILDIDVMPINIHSLMNSVPMANLYNYGYTFDRMLVDEFYGNENDYGNLLISAMCENSDDMDKMFAQMPVTNSLLKTTGSKMPIIRNNKELFVGLLINPYLNFNSKKAAYSEIAGLMRGAGKLPLGRPKFLSDEVFNKALLGSTYASNVGISNNQNTNVDSWNSGKLTYVNEHRGREHDPERLPADKYLSEVNLTNISSITGLGIKRFDTVFARNLVFLTNAYRSMRYKLENDIMYGRSTVLNSSASVRSNVTEFERVSTLPHRSRLANRHTSQTQPDNWTEE